MSQPVLAAVLARSELTISDLQDAGHIKHLHLPEGTLLTHYHGQHRLEAAKKHIIRKTSGGRPSSIMMVCHELSALIQVNLTAV
jgi:hypothetical protein